MSESKRLSERAIKVLEEVKAKIAERPANFAMESWFSTGTWWSDQAIADLAGGEECKTTACIAGWICVLRELKNSLPAYAATAYLGISPVRADRLFYAQDWPRDLYERYLIATHPLTRARIAAEAIDRFIAGDGSFD